MEQNKAGPQQDLSVDKLIGTSTAIHCPTKEEWDTVYGLLKKTGKYTRPIEDCWKNYQEKSCIICNSTYDRVVYCQSQGYPVVQARDVIAANQPSTGYKVGDWVYVLARSGECRTGDVRKIYHVKNATGILNLIYQLADEGAYWVGEEHIRMATPEEIAKATSKSLPTESKEWVPKVGDTVICIDTTTNWKSNNGSAKWRDNLVVGKKYTIGNISDGDISIVGGPWWHDIRSFRPATPEEIRKAQSKNDKEWICTSEDGVELYDGDRVQWVNVTKNLLTSPAPITRAHSPKAMQGCWTLFSTEQAAKEWIANQGVKPVGWQIGDTVYHHSDKTHTWVLESDGKGGIQSRQTRSGQIDKEKVEQINEYIADGTWKVLQEQVPGTNIGRRVRMKNFRRWRKYEGQIGVVIDDEWNRKEGSNQIVVNVEMPDGTILNPYTPKSEEDGGCQAECEWVNETNQINNNNQKQNKSSYEHEQQSKQQDSSSICKGSNLRTKVKEYEGQQPARGESVVSIRKIKPKIVEGGY